MEVAIGLFRESKQGDFLLTNVRQLPFFMVYFSAYKLLAIMYQIQTADVCFCQNQQTKKKCKQTSKKVSCLLVWVKSAEPLK